MDKWIAGAIGVAGGIVAGVIGSKLLSNPDELVYATSGNDCDDVRKLMNDRGISTGVCGTIPSKTGPVSLLWAPHSKKAAADQIVDSYVSGKPLPPVTSGLAGVSSARQLGAYTLDVKMKTYPMYPVGAGSLWNIWPGRKFTVRDGEGVYPDDGVWNREAGTHQGRY